jgi:hypothetical protein
MISDHIKELYCKTPFLFSFLEQASVIMLVVWVALAGCGSTHGHIQVIQQLDLLSFMIMQS